MYVAALRRLAVLLGVAAGSTALISLAFGLAAGAAVNRAISIGFYVVGSFLLVAGFFVGNRGPARMKNADDAVPFFGARRLRWATAEEREDALSTSAIFVLVGFTLILLGVVADSRYRLF
jgi:hypothetical protein